MGIEETWAKAVEVYGQRVEVRTKLREHDAIGGDPVKRVELWDQLEELDDELADLITALQPES